MTPGIWRLALLWGAVCLAGGCQTGVHDRDFKPTLARFYLEAANGEGTAVTLPRSGVTAVIGSRPVISEGDIINVELVQVDLGKCLMFNLTSAAARDFYRLSVTQNGRRLVLMLDDKPVGARRIDGAIADGTIFAFVEIPDADLPELVGRLKRSAVAIQREFLRK